MQKYCALHAFEGLWLQNACKTECFCKKKLIFLIFYSTFIDFLKFILFFVFFFAPKLLGKGPWVVPKVKLALRCLVAWPSTGGTLGTHFRNTSGLTLRTRVSFHSERSGEGYIASILFPWRGDSHHSFSGKWAS